MRKSNKIISEKKKVSDWVFNKYIVWINSFIICISMGMMFMAPPSNFIWAYFVIGIFSSVNLYTYVYFYNLEKVNKK